MKTLVFILLFLVSAVGVYSQSTLPLRADTILIQKVGGNANLKLQDASRDSTGGIYVNIGGGVLRAVRTRRLTDTTYIIGLDTIHVGNSTGGGATRFGIEDNLGVQDRYITMGNHELWVDSASDVLLQSIGPGNTTRLFLGATAYLQSLGGVHGHAAAVAPTNITFNTDVPTVPPNIIVQSVDSLAKDTSGISKIAVFKGDTLKSISIPDFATLIGSTIDLKDSNIVNALNQYPLRHFPIRSTLTDTCYFFGDSYTAGSGATAGYDWVTQFCYRMGCVMKNMGVAGTTLQKRVPIDYMASPNMVDNSVNIPTKTFKRKLLFFAFGLNDLGQTAAAYNVTNFKTDYDFVIAAAIAKGWQPWEIIIISPYWIGYAGYVTYAGITGNAAPTVQRHTDFVHATQEVATKWGLGYIDTYHAQLRNDTTLIGGDNIHPTDDGYKFLEFIISKYVGAEENILLGTKSPASVSSPLAINTGAKYWNGSNYDPAGIKLCLYCDGTTNNNFGFGVSGGSFNYFGGGATTNHNWFINGNTQPRMALGADGVTGTMSLRLDQNIGSIGAANPPYFSTGGGFNNSKFGDSDNLKIYVYQILSDGKAGLSLASVAGRNSYEYVAPWNVDHDWWTGPRNPMRLNTSGNLLINTTSDNGYRLQVNGAISTVTDSSASPINTAWIDTDGKIRKGPLGTASNFFNADLGATGDRNHTFNGHSMFLDSTAFYSVTSRGRVSNKLSRTFTNIFSGPSFPLWLGNIIRDTANTRDSINQSVTMQNTFVQIGSQNVGFSSSFITLGHARNSGTKGYIEMLTDSLIAKLPIKTTGDTLIVAGEFNSATSTNVIYKESLADARGYKVYTALLSQSSTSDPTATVLGGNQIGTIVWTRNSAGNYTGTLTGAFTSNKTWLICQKGDGGGSFVNALLSRASANAVTLDVRDNAGSVTDGYTNLSIEIRVYP